ncbi:hypothetical protein AtubIFM57258_010009 [Aspergillus tubingensis]|nr:hypothetical protein AtubIFM57258_010009 [Aspergillus tubingensis]
MACHISDSILSTLLRQQNWREYVETRYYHRHTTGVLGDHGLGRGWAWSNLVFSGSPAVCLLWPAGRDDLAEIEDNVGFCYECGLSVLSHLGIDDAYLARIFGRIIAAGRRQTIPAILSLDYVMRHMAQEKRSAHTAATNQLRVAKPCPEYDIIVWDFAENNFMQYHDDTQHGEGINATNGYVVTDLVHQIVDVGAEMATGEHLNTVASLVVEAFSRYTSSSCTVHRTSRTTGEAVASDLWVLSAYRHPCEEWASTAWKIAHEEIIRSKPLRVHDESCRDGLTKLFDKPYTVVPDDVVRSVDCVCSKCAEIQDTAYKITTIADGEDWQQECEETREWTAKCILHLTPEVPCRHGWLNTLQQSNSKMASERPDDAITLAELKV